MPSGRQELIALNRAAVFLLKHPYIAWVLLPACWLPLIFVYTTGTEVFKRLPR